MNIDFKSEDVDFKKAKSATKKNGITIGTSSFDKVTIEEHHGL